MVFFSISVEDCEYNDGTEERHFFMSKRLMLILGKENLAEKNVEFESCREGDDVQMSSATGEADQVQKPSGTKEAGTISMLNIVGEEETSPTSLVRPTSLES